MEQSQQIHPGTQLSLWGVVGTATDLAFAPRQFLGLIKNYYRQKTMLTGHAVYQRKDFNSALLGGFFKSISLRAR